MNPKIIISINTAWNIFNFRSGLIKAFVAQGYQVVAVTPNDEYSERLKEFGCSVVNMPMDSNGRRPVRDLLMLIRYLFLLRSERPLVFLGYTVKPNIYGSIAAQILGIPVVNNISGLGATFINNNFLTRIVRCLYKFALHRSYRVFFQNEEDQRLFITTGLVRSEITDLLPGSGLDLSCYLPVSLSPLSGRPFRFLLVARMLKDKGIREFVEAAKIVKECFPETEFQLLGAVNTANSNAISLETIEAWEDQGLVRYMGKTDNVRPYLIDSDCVVLPSYREGLPRSLLEAAAMARPIITTDTVGCRNVVDEGVSGFLCEVANANDLAKKMLEMIRLSPQKRLSMGEAGRRKVESEFDEKVVIQKYLDVVAAILIPALPHHAK
ncbi:glycosyltransferase family 4 protein [Glaciimonas sp. Gout2]|uniref:glycosyltransferase family 4 protein n=1 Tax=unclassified Glaciimonas TaxID=2644401 RepID=UPI002B237D34|nr:MULTISPECIES: glycosyltransferase family 4 protein [unclassified Glaciimonas]MEB0014188.1 glycosyltransferase family 4 protein [Glaciimonas sp. Cout2]MEB0084362.1 glycosyltransferase family 4 protein [Glaciimonas sp. Gout2]